MTGCIEERCCRYTLFPVSHRLEECCEAWPGFESRAALTEGSQVTASLGPENLIWSDFHSLISKTPTLTMSAYLWCLNMILCTLPLLQSCCCCHHSPHRWRGHISQRMGYSTSGGCSQCTVQYQASPHSDLAKQGRGALAQAVCSQSSNIFCSQQKSTSTMTEGIHSQTRGSWVPTAQLPTAQIGIAEVSFHLLINPTSKVEKGTSERAVMLDLEFNHLQKLPVPGRQKDTWRAWTHRNHSSAQVFSTSKLHLSWLGIYSFSPVVMPLSTLVQSKQRYGIEHRHTITHIMPLLCPPHCFGLHYFQKSASRFCTGQVLCPTDNMHETCLGGKILGRRVKACYKQLSSRSENRPLLIFSTGTTQMLHLFLELDREAVLPWNNKLKKNPKAGRCQPGALDGTYLAYVWHWFSAVCWTHEHLREKHFTLKLLSPVEYKRNDAVHADTGRQGFPAHSFAITSQGKGDIIWGSWISQSSEGNMEKIKCNNEKLFLVSVPQIQRQN